MKIKMTTLLKTEFGVKNPHKLLRDLKQIGNLSPKSLRKVFEDTPKERFDIEIVKKYVDYVYNHPNKTQLYYTPEYWMYRKNISYEEAVELVAQQKRDKSPSKEGYIKRYGEEKGLKLFEEFQKISSYSSSDEWFKEKYGDDWENKKIISNRRKSKRCVEYWTFRGFTEDEAKQKVSLYQKSTSGVHRDYYRNQGYSEDEIDIIINQIKKKKVNHCRNTNYLKEKYPDIWKEIYLESSQRYQKRMEELGIWIPKDIVDDFKKYRSLVGRYTSKSLLFYGNMVENLELRSKEYHIDHKYSIKMGFINDIDPQIIGSIINLEILPARINNSKKTKCSISKKDLLFKYKQFKETYEN